MKKKEHLNTALEHNVNTLSPLLCSRYMTAREQKLHERKKQAKELLEWKKRLDAEEQKVYMLEKKAIEAWGNKEKKKEEGAVKKGRALFMFIR